MSAVLSLRTSDLDEVWAFLDPQYYRSYTRLADRTQHLDACLDVVRLGPVTLGMVRFGAELRISITEIDAYQINVPRTGRLRWSQGGNETAVVAPGAAVTYQPLSRAEDRWSADCAVLSIKIEPAAVQAQLARMLDTPIRAPVRIQPHMDVAQGAGAGWARLVRLLAADATHPRGLAHHPLVRDQLVEALIGGLLLSTAHRYRDDLHHDARNGTTPRAVRHAVEAMREHPERPYTLATLADIAGVSGRTLQAAFQRHVGSTPMAYLRQVRLARAHDDLRTADPGRTTVAEIAYRWGFSHLGRFAGAYRARYGTPPSWTLNTP
ncbi:AraC family transcriptional regulator [Actinoplanes sp. CA-142083]|uniref:AraC family transcriptional regulator n=1 Tax=Actinoplanes sp. CA-142083 TaxID=3239903 RepID=UPI003D9031C7